MTSKSHPMLASIFDTANVANTMEKKPADIKKVRTVKEEVQVLPNGTGGFESGRAQFLGIQASLLCKLCQEKNDLECIERHCWNGGNVVTSQQGSVGVVPTSPGGTKLGHITDNTNMLPDKKQPNKNVIQGSIEGPVIIPLEPEIQSGVGLPSVLMDSPGFVHPMTELFPDNLQLTNQDKAGKVREPIVNVVPFEPTIQHGVALPSVLSDPIVANPITNEMKTETLNTAQTNFIPIAMPNAFSDLANNKVSEEMPLQPFKPPFQQVSELSPFHLDSAIVYPNQVETKTAMVDRSMTDISPQPKTFSEFMNMKEFQGQQTNANLPSRVLNTPVIDKATLDMTSSGGLSPNPSSDQGALSPPMESGKPSLTFQDVVNLEQILADLMVGPNVMTGTQDLSVSNILENNLAGVKVSPNGAKVDLVKEASEQSNANAPVIVVKPEVSNPVISVNVDNKAQSVSDMPHVNAQVIGGQPGFNKPELSVITGDNSPPVSSISDFNVPSENVRSDLNIPIIDIKTDVIEPSVNTQSGVKSAAISPGVNIMAGADTNNIDTSNFFIPADFDSELSIPDGLSATQMESIPFEPINAQLDQMDHLSPSRSDISLTPISSGTPGHGHEAHGHSHTDTGVVTSDAVADVVTVVSADEPAVFARERQRQMVAESDLPLTTPEPFFETTAIVTMNPVRRAELQNFAMSFMPSKN